MFLDVGHWHVSCCAVPLSKRATSLGCGSGCRRLEAPGTYFSPRVRCWVRGDGRYSSWHQRTVRELRWNPLSGTRVPKCMVWENLRLFSTWYFYSTWNCISPLPLHFESQRWRNRLLEFPFIIMALSHFCVLNAWPSKLSRNVLRYVHNLENYMVWFVSIVLQIFHWGFSSSESARCKSIRILYF